MAIRKKKVAPKQPKPKKVYPFGISDTKAQRWYEHIVGNLRGHIQVYRFFDRFAACCIDGQKINAQNMQAFMGKYPQYKTKINWENKY